MSKTPMDGEYIKAGGRQERMGTRLVAVVAQGDQERVYIAPSPPHEVASLSAKASWRPDTPLPDDRRAFWTVRYGLTTYGDLFTDRQLVALTTFPDLVGEAMEQVKRDIEDTIGGDASSKMSGVGLKEYSEAIGLYLAFALSKVANTGSTITSWMSDRGPLRETFARQAIPMAWDFAEANPLHDAGGSIRKARVNAPKVRTLGRRAAPYRHAIDVPLGKTCSQPPIGLYQDSARSPDLPD